MGVSCRLRETICVCCWRICETRLYEESLKLASYSGAWRNFSTSTNRLTVRSARASSAAEGMCSQSPWIGTPCRAAIGYTIGKPLVLFFKFPPLAPAPAWATRRRGWGAGFFRYESVLTYLDLAELALVASSLCDRAGGLGACADGAGRTGRRRP